MKRVLVVEDDRDIIESVQGLLESLDLEVVRARNGREALDAMGAGKRPIDLILLDLMMPQYSGWELLLELRSREPQSRIPIIVMSALAAPPGKFGAQAYLQKPFNPQLILDTVQRLLGIREAPAEANRNLRGASSLAPVSLPGAPRAHVWTMAGPLVPNVLIVDDDAGIRQATADVLSDYDFSTTTARDGEEALEVILNGSRRIDLIVLDLMMPRCDGWDLLRQLREHAELQHTPVLVVSALSKAGRDLNVDAFLPKPFEPTRFVETVERLTHHGGGAA